MPDREPFDGSVPYVEKLSVYLEPRRWAVCPRDDDPRDIQRFATWREAMNYAMHDTRPAACCGVCPPIVGGGYDCTCEGNPRCHELRNEGGPLMTTREARIVHGCNGDHD